MQRKGLLPYAIPASRSLLSHRGTPPPPLPLRSRSLPPGEGLARGTARKQPRPPTSNRLPASRHRQGRRRPRRAHSPSLPLHHRRHLRPGRKGDNHQLQVEASLPTCLLSVESGAGSRRATLSAASGGGGAYRRTSSGPLPAAGRNSSESGVSSRVRVAVRLRPRNTEEQAADADFADCVELQPFDEVLTEFSSQKRVYEVVAKPVVESVLEGYNGTVMAYGQTGTGKTFTLGRLGDEDTAARGIMVRAMDDAYVYEGVQMVNLLRLGRFGCADGGGEAAGPGERAGEEGVSGGGVNVDGAQPP